MPRASQAEAARHHEELIEAAAKLFRERGVASVSVPDVTAEIGLTRGAFYKHFESKDALVAAAVSAAFEEHFGRLAAMSEGSAGDRARTREAFVDFCLSAAHRDNPATGCPSALASAMAHGDADGAPRAAYVEGVRTLLDELAARTDAREGKGTDEGDPEAQEQRILADLCTTVGAVLLARATAGDPISDRILVAARGRLLDEAAGREPRQ